MPRQRWNGPERGAGEAVGKYMPVPNKPSRNAPLMCPLSECRKVCFGTQGLTAHVRTAHEAHYRRYGTGHQPDVAPPAAPPVVSPPPVAATEEVVAVEMFVSEVTEASSASPLELLDQAIEQLSIRSEEIAAELRRLDDLNREQEAISRRITALKVARRAFEPVVAPATAVDGEHQESGVRPQGETG